MEKNCAILLEAYCVPKNIVQSDRSFGKLMSLDPKNDHTIHEGPQKDVPKKGRQFNWRPFRVDVRLHNIFNFDRQRSLEGLF